MHLIPGFHAPRLDATDHRAQCPNHEPLLITKVKRKLTWSVNVGHEWNLENNQEAQRNVPRRKTG